MVSPVWEVFTEDGKEKNPNNDRWDKWAICNKCGDRMKCSQGSTSTLFSHLQ